MTTNNYSYCLISSSSTFQKQVLLFPTYEGRLNSYHPKNWWNQWNCRPWMSLRDETKHFIIIILQAPVHVDVEYIFFVLDRFYAESSNSVFYESVSNNTRRCGRWRGLAIIPHTNAGLGRMTIIIVGDCGWKLINKW